MEIINIKMKKIISVCIVLTMLATLLLTVSVSAENKIIQEVAGTEYEKAVRVVSALGIMQGDTKGVFDGDKELTRAEILTVVLRMMGLPDASVDGLHSFSDVPETHWATKMIGAGVSLEIVGGDGDGKFRPDDAILSSEALKMVVCALGYNSVAENRGGFPIGYINVGTTLNLTDDVDFEAQQPMLRWQCAQMVYNALDVSLLREVYGSEVVSEISSNTTLGYIFNTTKKRGVITSVPGIELSGSPEIEPDEKMVAIDGILYKTELELGDMLGKTVDFYLKQDSDKVRDIVIECFEYVSSDDVIVLDMEQIISVTANTSANIVIKYWDNNDKEKQFNFNGIDILYNDEAVSFSDKTQLQEFLDANLNQGELRILPGDSADKLFIKNYKAYVVERVNINEEKIYYIVYGKTVNTNGVLDLSDRTKEYVIYNEAGDLKALKDLRENDVISVYVSLDGQKTSIYYTAQKVSGKIDSLRLIGGSAPSDYIAPWEEVTYDSTPFYEASYGDWPFTYATTGTPTLRPTTIYGTDQATTTATPGKISYAQLKIETENNGTTEDDEVFEKVIYSSPGVVKTGNTVKFGIDRSNARTEFSFLFSPITIGSEITPEKLKVELELYLTDIYKKTDVPDTGNTIETLPITIHLVSGTSNLTRHLPVTVDVPVNQWHTVTAEWTLNGQVKDIHGFTLDTGINYTGIDQSKTAPFASMVYYGGDIKVHRGDVEIVDLNNTPSDAEYEVVVDGKKYKIADTFDDSLVVWSPLGIGTTATFLLDSFGKIVGYTVSTGSTENYGILMAVGLDDSPFGTDKVKILTSKNEMKIFNCADEIRAYNGTSVIKAPLSYFVTDNPADPKTDWHIWSTNNASNFVATNRTWLSEQEKSNIASRKVVYYKTNSKDEITTILVPSMPAGMQDSKITMLNKTAGFYLNNNYGMILRLSPSATPDGESPIYRKGDKPLVFEVQAYEYDEANYKVASAVPNVSYPMTLYSTGEDGVADIIVYYPSRVGSPAATNMMISSIEQAADGIIINGYSKGTEVSVKVPEELRIMEQRWYRSDKTTKLTEENLSDAYKSGERPVRLSYEYFGETTPTVVNAGLKEGDIIAYQTNNEGYMTYCEAMLRTDDGVNLYHGQKSTDSMNNIVTFADIAYAGRVVKTGKPSGYVAINSYFWNGASNLISDGDEKNAGSVIVNMELWYNMKAVGKINVYEVGDRGVTVYSGTVNDIDEGDRVFATGSLLSPTNVFVWKD